MDDGVEAVGMVPLAREPHKPYAIGYQEVIECSMHALEECTDIAAIVGVTKRKRRMVEPSVGPTVVGCKLVRSELSHYFVPHFVSRVSPIVPPEITSPCTGFPRKMILVSSLYAFGPDLFQALHGASMRHSLNVLAVQVNIWLRPSSAKLGTVAPINNINAVNTRECKGIMVSDEVDGS
jgi:hypothetical protein